LRAGNTARIATLNNLFGRSANAAGSGGGDDPASAGADGGAGSRAAELHRLHDSLCSRLAVAGVHPLKDVEVIQIINELINECLIDQTHAVGASILTWQIAAYKTAYPRNHPMIGLQLHLLADVLDELAAKNVGQVWDLGGETQPSTKSSCGDLSRRACQDALAVLQTTHGQDHPMVQALREGAA